MEIQLLGQPNETSCGQTVMAMALGVPVEEVIKLLGHSKATYALDWEKVLLHYGYEPTKIVKVDNRKRYTIPDMSNVRINRPGRLMGHALLYNHGLFYDPSKGGRVFSLNQFKEYYPKWRIDGYRPIRKKVMVEEGVAGIGDEQ